DSIKKDRARFVPVPPVDQSTPTAPPVSGRPATPPPIVAPPPVAAAPAVAAGMEATTVKTPVPKPDPSSRGVEETAVNLPRPYERTTVSTPVVSDDATSVMTRSDVIPPVVPPSPYERTR